jgi:hypothetical protein
MSLRIEDNQAINARPGGDAVWITDFITPSNPDVVLLHQKLTSDIAYQQDRILACWRYVAHIPYRETVRATLNIAGRSYSQSDAWLYPSEMIRLAPVGNCANKSFLLTSLLRNELPDTAVRCALGHLQYDGIGAHAWVSVDMPDGEHYLEATVENLERALIPADRVGAYEPVMYFNDTGVWTVSDTDILNEHFGFCAIPWLKSYLCQRCQDLEAP